MAERRWGLCKKKGEYCQVYASGDIYYLTAEGSRKDDTRKGRAGAGVDKHARAVAWLGGEGWEAITISPTIDALWHFKRPVDGG